MPPLQNVSLACFGLSYALAFLAELLRLRWPRRSLRLGGLILGFAGLFAHSLFLAYHQPNFATAYGALLAVAWVLGIFYLYGTIHHPKQAWAIFVLPLILGLIALAYTTGQDPNVNVFDVGSHFWGATHGILLLLASVGLSVGCIASVMYLLQARRLRMKLNPLGGLKMLSLERLEAMNRRAVNLSFPLLTLGLLLGVVLLKQYHGFAENWFSLKVLGTSGLWLVSLLLMYLRYAVHVSGRRLALLTILAFVLMVTVLVASHPFVRGESP